MPKIHWELDPEPPPLYEEPEPPLEGWHKPCQFEDHRWAIEIAEGKVSLVCLNPCDPNVYDPRAAHPTCLTWWESDDLSTPDPIPVRPVFVDDSTPGGPWGPAEYGYWIDLLPVEG